MAPIIQTRRLDHIGLTVPDLDEAQTFFEDVFGFSYLYSMGPMAHDDDWMTRQLNVPADAVVPEIRFLRLGALVLELFAYDMAGQNSAPVRNCDIGGHHFAFYVDDLDEAVAALRAAGVTLLGDTISSIGLNAGQRWIYFLSPWGEQFELVSYPHGKAFDRQAGSPSQPAETPES